MNGKDYTVSASRTTNKKIKKQVNFDSNVKILNMYVWRFAYQEARKSNWMRIAADRYRFELRKQKIELMLRKIGFFTLK